MAELKDEIAAEEARFKSVVLLVGRLWFAALILTSSLFTERLPLRSLLSKVVHGTTKSKLRSTPSPSLHRRR